MTPRARKIRLDRIERLRAEVLDLDRKHPNLRGMVIVGRAINGGSILIHLERFVSPLPTFDQPHPWSLGLSRLAEPPGLPNARNEQILPPLMGDDLGIIFAGDSAGYSVLHKLAERVADLDFDLPGVGRFGGFSSENPHTPLNRLLVFLAAFAVQRPEGSVIRADLIPFADPGWEPVQEGRTAVLDPEGEANGSAFTLTIRQGLFDALSEMLAVAAIELSEATATVNEPSQIAPATELPPAKDSSPGRLKEPSSQAIECYRIKFIRGESTTQSNIAKLVYGDPSKQGQVSKDIDKVKKWIGAGNILPVVGEPEVVKITPLDPSKLDGFARSDRRRKPANPKRD